MKKLLSTLLLALVSFGAVAQITGPQYNPAAVAITGGSINGATIGATVRADIFANSGSFNAGLTSSGGSAASYGLVVSRYTLAGGWNYLASLSDSVNATILIGMKSGSVVYQADATTTSIAPSNTESLKITTASTSALNKIFPGTDAGAFQSTAGIYGGSGVPSNANGNNGDYYFRSDTPGTALQRIYVKSAGAWVGII
jgi:hypothetical protein